MENSKASKGLSSSETDHVVQKNEVQELLQALKQQTSWDGRRLYHYNGFWYTETYITRILSFQNHFKPIDSDIILATMPKSGTTWLKALTFSIVNRHLYTPDQTPLLTSNPHALVPFLEFDIYSKNENPNLEDMPRPRIFAAHMPYQFLPRSILESKCQIICICRNPLDQFVSHQHFLHANKAQFELTTVASIEEAFDLFCQGVHVMGPIWEHILGYWNAYQGNPKKVLFLKYEDLKDDISFQVKKIAQFVGVPFSLGEEKQGLVEQISNLCSIENLRSLEVNMNGTSGRIKNSSYFRKGEIGDATNYLTPEMIRRFEKILQSKLEGSNLTFKAS